MAVPAFAQGAPEGAMSPFIKDYLGQVDFVAGRILTLNQATAKTETWCPISSGTTRWIRRGAPAKA